MLRTSHFLASLLLALVVPMVVLAKGSIPNDATGSPARLDAIEASQCQPYCTEVVFSRESGHLFLVFADGRKQYLTTYFPQWKNGDPLRPEKGEQFSLREVASFASSKAFSCGDDGWGWNQGENTFTPYETPGGATVTGTYTGAGGQTITTTYPNGSGSSRGADSGFKPGSGAGAGADCKRMRKELKDSGGATN